MKSQKMKALFLRQSYIDSWQSYIQSLTKKSFIQWDYIILTASNEAQAKTYEAQIKDRIKGGYLPVPTHYAVLPDPDGKRVGSGGATFNVLRYIKQHTSNDSFAGKRILVIHSGGDSKRVPQYSACGKLFSPVPRTLPDGRRSTLFDEFIIATSNIPSRLKDGMLVLSGDVLLLFNSLQIDYHSDGAAAISIKENVQTGKNHGVFATDEKGYVCNFLHKCSEEELRKNGAVNEQDNVDLDTGAILMSSKMTEDLYALIDTDDKFKKFVNEKARISFYADFLYPLASNSTLEQYYKETPEGDFTPELKECRTLIWEALHKYSLYMISLSPAQFIHFGTTRELLKLMTEEISSYEFLDWEKQVASTKRVKTNCALSNSFIDTNAEIDSTSYIEDSYILGNTKIGKNCIISNMVLEDAVVEDYTVLHGLKLQNGKFVVRKYKTDTNPKVDDFWNEKIFPVCDTLEESYNNGGGELTSLADSYNMADTRFIMDYQKKLQKAIGVQNFISDIKAKKPHNVVLSDFNNIVLDKEQEKHLNAYAKKADFSIKSRIYYYLSLLTKDREKYYDLCFKTIQKSIMANSASGIKYNPKLRIAHNSVVANLPVRVNFGGGWSDTPPYCNENGGTVINAAISLKGNKPIFARLKRIDKPCVELSSVDANNAKHEFTSIKELQNCSNPFDPFALHKAALIACGVIPKSDDIPLDYILKEIGGGFSLETEVLNVPRGSGLGTSSILAATCVKGIYDFFGITAENNEYYEKVMCVEQLMSTGGGWQDQIGGFTNGIKFITTAPGLTQNINVSHIEISEDTKQELNERFALIYTGQRRLARNLLRQVVSKYLSYDEVTVEVLNKIQRLAFLIRFELEKGHIDAFAKLLTEHWELSQLLDKGCTNTCIDQIFLSIDDMIDGKFIAGAGGGGFLQVILKKGVTKEMLSERLKSVFQDSGVDVWDSEFLF